VDPDDFRDAPGGGRSGEEAFADLVNAIPVPGPTFVDSARQYDQVYKLIIDGATAPGDVADPVSAQAATALQEARFAFDGDALVRQDAPTDTYHRAGAIPSRWWDAGANWTAVSFGIGTDGEKASDSKPAAERSPFAAPGFWTLAVPTSSAPPLAWRSLPLDPNVAELAALARPEGFLSLGRARTSPRRAGILARFDDASARTFSTPRAPVARVESFDDAAPGPVHARAAAPRPALASLQHATTRAALEALEEAPEGLKFRHLLGLSRAVDQKTVASAALPPPGGFSFALEYCVVSVSRRWLRRELFDLPGLRLPGFAPGAISNGQPADNPGILPAVTTRFLAVRNLVVRSAWSEGDRGKAQRAGRASGPLSFGPFAVTGGSTFDGTELRRAAPQIVAWLAAVVPAWPRG
jgi:hypothetical protein